MRYIAAAWLVALLAVHTLPNAFSKDDGQPVVRMARYGTQQGAQAADTLHRSQVWCIVRMFLTACWA